MTLEEILSKIMDDNIARAKAFAEMFPGLSVTHCGTEGNVGMAAYHNKETGWGFTVQFITSPDMKQHIHAFVEFVGPQDAAMHVAEQFKKIVGD